MSRSIHACSIIAAILWSASAGAADLQDQIVASILGHAAAKVTVAGASPNPENSFQDRVAAAIGGHPAAVQSAADRNQPAQQNHDAETDFQARIAASIVGRSI